MSADIIQNPWKYFSKIYFSQAPKQKAYNLWSSINVGWFQSIYVAWFCKNSEVQYIQDSWFTIEGATNEDYRKKSHTN